MPDPDRVRIHWNLRRRCWSRSKRQRRLARGGRLTGPLRWIVTGHDTAFLLQGARFVVSPSGHAASLSRGHRTVHAWVEGTPALRAQEGLQWVAVRYDRVSGRFRVSDAPNAYVEAGTVILGADWVTSGAAGSDTVYAAGLLILQAEDPPVDPPAINPVHDPRPA